MKSLLENPKIVLLANDKVGLAIAEYLKKRKENIIALVLHPKDIARRADEIVRTIRTKNIFYADQLRNPRVLERIKSLNPDLAICAWFGYILPKAFIKIFPLGCFNLHNSYLPYNRGKYPHVWAIYDGSKYGVTIHYVDPNIDTGPIVAQKKLKVEITDIAGTLYERSLEEIVKLFIATWPKIKQGEVRPKPQNEKLATSHLAKDVEKLDFIDLNKKYLAKDLINQLRARSFSDRTYAYFSYRGRKIYVKLTLFDKPTF